MRKILAMAITAGSMLVAGSAFAMDDMYTSGTGDNMMVMGGMTGDKGAPVATTKDKCQDGGYYMSGDKMITACADGGMTYEMSAPEKGAMMGDKPYPEGGMMMKEHKM